MVKQAVSVTLDQENLLWLRGLAAASSGRRSVSRALDQLVREARLAGRAPHETVRSIVGTIDLDASDPLLERADAAMRAQFDGALARPFLVREPRAPYAGRRRRRAPRRRDA